MISHMPSYPSIYKGLHLTPFRSSVISVYKVNNTFSLSLLLSYECVFHIFLKLTFIPFSRELVSEVLFPSPTSNHLIPQYTKDPLLFIAHSTREMAAWIEREYNKCPDTLGLKKVHVFMEANNNILEERHVYIGWHNSPTLQQQIRLTGLGKYAFYPQMLGRKNSAIAGHRVSIQLGTFDHGMRNQIAELAGDITNNFSLTGEDGNC